MLRQPFISLVNEAVMRFWALIMGQNRLGLELRGRLASTG